MCRLSPLGCFHSWWARQDLNLRPTDYESAALTAELRAPIDELHPMILPANPACVAHRSVTAVKQGMLSHPHKHLNSLPRRITLTVLWSDTRLSRDSNAHRIPLSERVGKFAGGKSTGGLCALPKAKSTRKSPASLFDFKVLIEPSKEHGGFVA